jgi:predicted metal-dependent peptidase
MSSVITPLAGHVIDDFDRIARINRIMSSCLDKRLNLVAEALMLGYPHFTDDPMFPTSAIQITPDGRIRYVWNRKFFDKATDLAAKYICFHEALHVILKHVQRRGDREPRMWNIAVDIAVNEILDDLLPRANLADIYDINDDPILKPRCKSGSKGIYTNNEAAETIYNKLMEKQKEDQEEDQQKQKQKSKQDGDDNQDGSGGSSSLDGKESEDEGDTDGSGDQPGQGDGALDDHGGWDNNLSSDTQQELNELVKEIKENEEKINKPKGRRGRRAGNASDHLTEELGEVDKPPVVPWQKLVRNRLASVYRPNDSENWARVHRKLYQFYPDVILPGPHDSDILTSSIFFTIDTSGSMDISAIADFAAIAESLPKDDFEVVFTWFDTEVYKVTDLRVPMGRGGTSFHGIEDVVSGQKPIWSKERPYYERRNEKTDADVIVSRYPDIVIVLTDGEASTPTLLHPERWIFIITKDGTDQYVKDLGSTVWKL